TETRDRCAALARVDSFLHARIIRVSQSTPAEETPSVASGSGWGAEGATAPEPLRQKDRRLMALWKAADRPRSAHRRGKAATRRNLSGPVTEGACSRAEVRAKAKPWDPSEHERRTRFRSARQAHAAQSPARRPRRQNGGLCRL